MKKKLLYISIKNPFSKKFSGDRERAKHSIKYLKKFYNIDLVCLEKNKNTNIKNINVISFKQNFFEILINLLFSIFINHPIQIAFFKSKKLKKYITANLNNYDCMVCNTIRTAQYIPDNYKGKKILDMIDLLSSNYNQTFNKLSIFNPFCIIYYIESKRIRNYEKLIHSKFEKIFLVSKKDILMAKKFIPKKKIFFFPMGTNQLKLLYKFNPNNNKILFIGNIKYLPNKLACYKFTKQILPEIIKIDKKIKFYIIGEINIFDKIIFKFKKNVIVLGKVKNLSIYSKKIICGLCNVEIATGFQTKILTYMSLGIPTITSKNTMVDKRIVNNKNVLVYNNKNELIKKILDLKNTNKLSNKISKNSYKAINLHFTWNKVCKKYFVI